MRGELVRGDAAAFEWDAATVADAGDAATLIRAMRVRTRPDVREAAAGRLRALVAEGAVDGDAIGAADGWGALTGLAEDVASATVREHVAAIIGALAQQAVENQEALRASGAVLATVLALGDVESAAVREEAAAAVGGLVNGNAANQDLVRELGGVPLLVRLLSDASSSTTVASVVQSLLLLAAENTENRRAVVRSLLGRLFVETDAVAQRDGARLLVMLSAEDRETRDTICEAQRIHALVRLLEEGEDESEFALVAGTLGSFAEDRVEGQEQIREAGGIPHFVRLLNVATPADVRLQALVAVTNLGTANAANQAALREAGGLPELIHMLVDAQFAEHLAYMAAALGLLVREDAANRASVAAMLVALLSAAETADRQTAAFAIAQFAADAEPNPDALREAEAFPALIADLADASAGVRHHVARAMALACQSNGTNREVVRDAVGLPVLIELLADAESGIVREQAGAALAAAAKDNASVQEAIRALGGVEALILRIRTEFAALQARPDAATAVISGHDSGTGHPIDVLNTAFRALASLSLNNPVLQNAIRELEGILVVIQIIRESSNDSLKRAVAAALHPMVDNNSKSCDVFKVFGRDASRALDPLWAAVGLARPTCW